MIVNQYGVGLKVGSWPPACPRCYWWLFMHSRTIPIKNILSKKIPNISKKIQVIGDYPCTAVQYQSNTLFLRKTIEQYQFDTNILSSRDKYFNVIFAISKLANALLMTNWQLLFKKIDRDFEYFVWSSIADLAMEINLCFHFAFGDILSISL